jgi:hypothetical protein
MEGKGMIGFLIGFFLGGFLGAMVCALIVVGSEDDRRR